jgi:FtsH-binding integral membrane protein
MKNTTILLALFIGFSGYAVPQESSFVGPWQWLVVGVIVIIIFRIIKNILKKL